MNLNLSPWHDELTKLAAFTPTDNLREDVITLITIINGNKEASQVEEWTQKLREGKGDPAMLLLMSAPGTLRILRFTLRKVTKHAVYPSTGLE
jgi:hypothetical protein